MVCAHVGFVVFNEQDRNCGRSRAQHGMAQAGTLARMQEFINIARSRPREIHKARMQRWPEPRAG